MKAEIITIGDEILIGQIIDTNSAWIAEKLNLAGVKVIRINSVSDDPLHLVNALNSARKRADLIIMTGGLGPTNDDRTKQTLANYFSTQLVIHKPSLEHIKLFFSNRGLPITPMNEDQALVPECCTVLLNPVGTAPGMWIESDGIIFISMPGVPFEMKQIMTEEVLPRLDAFAKGDYIIHRTIQTIDIPESFLAKQLEEWERELPSSLHLAYLPSTGIVRLRLSAYGSEQQKLSSELDLAITKLESLIPRAIFGYGEISIAEAVGDLLIKHGSMVAVAESCTGGMISHQITSIAGSSEWFKGAVVAYSNDIKEKILGVDSKMLQEFGAVSEQVVRQMAEGVRKLMGTDYAIATSGVAGPGGGSLEKPVGTVWIAVAGPLLTEVRLFNFANNRERNILRASQTSLNMLRLMLKEQKGTY